MNINKLHIDINSTYLLNIFDEITHWKLFNFSEISSFFESNYQKIYEPFVLTYIYLNWSSGSNKFDFFIRKSEKCLFKVSLIVQRFHFFFVGRTAQ